MELRERTLPGTIVFLDLEFTCWPDSLATNWCDPRRPPEVIEIGIVAADMADPGIRTTFSTIVAPVVNPILSEYCQGVTGITPEELVGAPSLPDAAGSLGGWLRGIDPEAAITCTWGPKEFDRGFFSADCVRKDVEDPFGSMPNVDLGELAGATFGVGRRTGPTREEVWRLLELPDMQNRHRALSDAEDLERIFKTLQARLPDLRTWLR